jgi:site-specific DNA recombinase
MMKSPAVIGEVTVNDGNGSKALRDGTGMAIKRAEPLIDRETWERVKALLADNAARKGPMVNRAALLNIAFCGKCGRGFNLTSASWNGKTYYYYRCPNERLKRGCDAKRIPAAELESYAEQSLMMRVGSMNVTEEVHMEGIDYSTQMAEIAEAIGALSSKMALARATGQDVSKLEAQHAVHESKLAELAQAQTSARPPETKEIELDETWSERWQRLEWPDRSALLRRKEMRLSAERDAEGKIRGSWNLGTIQSKHQFSAPETS